MAEPPIDADAETGTPHWVKVSGIIVTVLALLVIIMVVTGHGPGRHMLSGYSLPSGVTKDMPGDRAPPEGIRR